MNDLLAIYALIGLFLGALAIPRMVERKVTNFWSAGGLVLVAALWPLVFALYPFLVRINPGISLGCIVTGSRGMGVTYHTLVVKSDGTLRRPSKIAGGYKVRFYPEKGDTWIVAEQPVKNLSVYCLKSNVTVATVEQMEKTNKEEIRKLLSKVPKEAVDYFLFDNVT